MGARFLTPQLRRLKRINCISPLPRLCKIFFEWDFIGSPFTNETTEPRVPSILLPSKDVLVSVGRVAGRRENVLGLIDFDPVFCRGDESRLLVSCPGDFVAGDG